MHNFAAYLDLAVQIQPALYLVGGVYNFEVTNEAEIRLNNVLCAKPYMGVMQAADQTPYLFFLLRTQTPLTDFHQADVSFRQNKHTIHWRMLGSHLFDETQHLKAHAHIRNYPENLRRELEVLMNQHLSYFPASEYGPALRAIMSFS
jgi:hypothetical protein